MRGRSPFLLVLLLIALGALAFRLPDLGNRPMHGDEAVHAFKFRELWKQGVYRYDPNEFHGPTLYYAALPSVWGHGRHDFADTREADFRLPIVLFGAAMVLLFGLLADGLGRRSALCAALLTAVSPAFVFYSRYYIQEMLLAFFTLAVIGCGWRYVRGRRPGWLILAGISAGAMVASKETALLSFGAFGIGVWLTAFWTKRIDNRRLPLRSLWNGKQIAMSLVVGLAVACLFLSGFLSNLAGPLDYLRAYTPWLHRAQGTDLHRHPWYYYLQILVWTHKKGSPVWSEGLIVGLALVGMVAALLPKEKGRLEGSVTLGRFLTFFTLSLTLVYSLIPYKTPWCVLSFLLGMVMSAGQGAAFLLGRATGRSVKALTGLLLLAACVHLGFQAYRASFIFYTDEHNPYVYAQPVPDAVNLEKRPEMLARAWPQHEAMRINVFSVDNYYWPLPWYLRRFPNVGYWTEIPKDTDAPLVLASPEYEEELGKKLNDTHLMNGYIRLRTGTFFEVWVRLDLWKNYLELKKAGKAGL